jgi:hypothetical protein
MYKIWKECPIKIKCKYSKIRLIKTKWVRYEEGSYDW